MAKVGVSDPIVRQADSSACPKLENSLWVSTRCCRTARIRNPIQDVERSFLRNRPRLQSLVFSCRIGLTSDYRALAGHWTLMLVILSSQWLAVDRMRLAALALEWTGSAVSGLMRDDFARRGGPIVTANGGKHWIFGRSEVAVMVAGSSPHDPVDPVLAGAFQLNSVQDLEEAFRILNQGGGGPQRGSSPESSAEREDLRTNRRKRPNLDGTWTSASLLALSSGEALQTLSIRSCRRILDFARGRVSLDAITARPARVCECGDPRATGAPLVSDFSGMRSCRRCGLTVQRAKPLQANPRGLASAVSLE